MEMVNHSGGWTQQALEELQAALGSKDEKAVAALILELCALLYFLDCRRSVSWGAAAGYALRKLPPAWGPLIHQALFIGCDRPEAIDRVPPSRYDRLERNLKEDARGFASFFIDYVNREYGLFYTD